MQGYACLYKMSGETVNSIPAADIRIFASQARAFQAQADKDRADSIFEISSRANRAIYEKLYKEDANMCATLMDIMKEDIDRKVQQEKLSNIRDFMSASNWPAQKVMDALKIPPEQQARYAELL